MYDVVLVATDGSDCAAAAVSHAVDLAERYGATLHALFVVDKTYPAMAEFDAVVERQEGEGERALESVRADAEARGLEVDIALRRGKPYEEILGFVDHNDVDVVFVGTKGRSAVQRLVHAGSTTERLIRRTTVPVVAVPHRDEERDGSDDGVA